MEEDEDEYPKLNEPQYGDMLESEEDLRV